MQYKNWNFTSRRIKNILGTGKNVCYKHFLYDVFKGIFVKVVKSRDYVVGKEFKNPFSLNNFHIYFLFVTGTDT